MHSTHTYIYILYLPPRFFGKGSLSWPSVPQIAAVLQPSLLVSLLFFQFLGGRDTVRLCAGQGALMREPCM